MTAEALANDVQSDPDSFIDERDRRRLLAFTRRMYPGYQTAPHHRKITEALEAVERGDIDRLIITVPPRHGKSLIASEHFPTWFLGRNPHKRIIACSHTAQLAYTFSRRARNKITDPVWPFPDVSIADDKGAVQAWDIEGNTGGYIAAGVGGPIVGSGAHVLLIDDPVKSAADADSATAREAVWEWYTGTAYHRLEPPGAIVLIMTRWHEDDLAGRLLAEQATGGDQWTVIDLPAIADEDDRLGREPGDALWPEKYDVPALERIKRNVGSRVWQALYQGQPQPSEGGMFKRHWWRYWQPRGEQLPPVKVKMPDGSTRDVWAQEQPAWWETSAQSWDMAFKETKGGSFVVGLVGGTYGPNLYLTDRFRERVDFPGTLVAVRSMSARHPNAAAKLIEDKANGPAVIATLRSELPGLIPVQTDGGKESRANAVTPFVEGGNVYLPHPLLAPWVDEFLAELAAFPTGAHDDQVDAFSQLARYLMGDAGNFDDLDAYYQRTLGRGR